jgi:hypothetical protein
MATTTITYQRYNTFTGANIGSALSALPQELVGLAEGVAGIAGTAGVSVPADGTYANLGWIPDATVKARYTDTDGKAVGYKRIVTVTP